ncbi:hypothetical protein HMPREF2811_02785 [Globicatella sp. HMSC072A10]|uniref:hypothetical protein n=1 Tax=Globicatella sp. HMSC072A10 TaxID=1739315 RepID=UPI0008CA65AA|nr:hypothetical protein [Globicatella sp. HMSC072A10]OFK61727.1 hypothetical protein HMPREF2811_02785 [Globicatella sp. HMSC072A10]
MHKKLTKLSLFLLMTSLSLPMVQAEESNQTETTLQPKTTVTPTETSTTLAADESDTTGNITSIVEKNGESQYDFKDPQALLEALKNSPENKSSMFNLMESENGVDFTLDSLSVLKDNHLYYILSQKGNDGGTNVVIQTDEQENVKTSFYLAEDLAKLAAERLNNDYEHYKDSSVEAYYVYAQEHIEDILGTYIEHSEANEANHALLQRLNSVDHWMLDLIAQYVEKNTNRAEVHQTDQEGTVYVFNIDQKESQQLAQLTQTLAEGTDETNRLTEELKKGYLGTISFSMKLGEISMSLATDDAHHIIEYHIGLEKATIKQPDAEKIISSQEFIKKTGIDIFADGLVSVAIAETTSSNDEENTQSESTVETDSAEETTTLAETTIDEE